jgi:hypothetical protein
MVCNSAGECLSGYDFAIRNRLLHLRHCMSKKKMFCTCYRLHADRNVLESLSKRHLFDMGETTGARCVLVA